MPSLPNFSLAQTDSHLIIKIKLPYIRVSKSETIIEGTSFHFSCSPYLLKLTFPGALIDTEDDPAKGTYDVDDDNGTLTCTIRKEVQGEHFPDLDLTTKMLQVTRMSEVERENHIPSIEVVGETSGVSDTGVIPYDNSGLFDSAGNPVDLTSYDDDDDDDFTPDFTPSSTAANTYGFNRGFSKCFSGIRAELKDMCECHMMDELDLLERRTLRFKAEEEKFDRERYQGDFWVNDERCGGGEEGEGRDPIYEQAVGFVPHWLLDGGGGGSTSASADDDLAAAVEGLTVDGSGSAPPSPPPSPPSFFTVAEQAQLAALPNKEHLITKLERRSLLLGMLDVLYGYAYDHRVTEGDPNVETPWTVSILAPTLSWFEAYDPAERKGEGQKSYGPVAAPLVAAVRRSLIYPYLRYFSFSSLVVTDVLAIVNLGRRAALRCFLAVHRAFETSEMHYMLNKFYVNDYCLFLQNVTDGDFADFAEEVGREVRLGEVKGWCGLGLEDLEVECLAGGEGNGEWEVGEEGGESAAWGGGEEAFPVKPPTPPSPAADAESKPRRPLIEEL